MDELIDYIKHNAMRGACQCGHCADAVENPNQYQPNGHTADVVFFKVSAMPKANRDVLAELLSLNKQGCFNNIDLLDGKEHSFIEIGGWIGDQGLALTLMGLGAILGLWKLLTPKTVLGDAISKDMEMQMAGMGYVSIQI